MPPCLYLRDWYESGKSVHSDQAYRLPYLPTPVSPFHAEPLHIPDYQRRKRAGLWIASTRVEKYNDWAVSGRCKHRGMSWSPQGVLALAALEAARRNGELEGWREDRALPERALPDPLGQAA